MQLGKYNFKASAQTFFFFFLTCYIHFLSVASLCVCVYVCIPKVDWQPPAGSLHYLGTCQVHDNRVFAPVNLSLWILCCGWLHTFKQSGEGFGPILLLFKWLIILSGSLWPSFDWQNCSCWHSATDAVYITVTLLQGHLTPLS